MDIIDTFDNFIFQVVSSCHCPLLDRFFTFFSEIGNFGIIWIILIICVLCSRRYRYYGVTAILALIISMILVHLILKPVIDRPRPFEFYEGLQLLIPPPVGASFPSGHAASSFAVAACLFAANRKVGIHTIILAALISISRIYLFVHFPSDVLVGAILGCMSALLALLFKRQVINKIPRLR